jgi:hypothetical protein
MTRDWSLRAAPMADFVSIVRRPIPIAVPFPWPCVCQGPIGSPQDPSQGREGRPPQPARSIEFSKKAYMFSLIGRAPWASRDAVRGVSGPDFLKIALAPCRRGDIDVGGLVASHVPNLLGDPLLVSASGPNNRDIHACGRLLRNVMPAETRERHEMAASSKLRIERRSLPMAVRPPGNVHGFRSFQRKASLPDKPEKCDSPAIGAAQG